jgi:hypothetical protein
MLRVAMEEEGQLHLFSLERKAPGAILFAEDWIVLSESFLRAV